MTPSELKFKVETRGGDSHFFTRATMKFHGDSMRNYGVRAATVTTNYNAAGDYVGKEGLPVECWELYRKHAVKHGVKGSAYFAKDTFRRVFPA